MLLGLSGGVAIYQWPDLSITFTAAANDDDDGDPDAYTPGNTGRDTLADAQDGQGNWCGIAVDPNGKPYVQGPNDPQPGAYVSTTSYEWPQFPIWDPRRYLDAQKVPYVVVPGSLRRRCKGILLGAAATVQNLSDGLSVVALVGDVGPRVGELSSAANIALGVDPDPRNGGDQRPKFYYTLRPGTPAVVNGVTYPLIRL